MTWKGVTTSHRVFTDDKWENLITKVNLLLSSVAALLILFVHGHSKEELENVFASVIAAAVFALIYFLLFILDSVLRNYDSEVRVFGEASLVSGFCAVVSLTFVLYDHQGLAVAALVIAVITFYLGFVIFLALQEEPPKDNPRLADTLARMTGTNFREQVLYLSTLIGLLFKGQDPVTETLYQELLATNPQDLVAEEGSDGPNPPPNTPHHPPAPPPTQPEIIVQHFHHHFPYNTTHQIHFSPTATPPIHFSSRLHLHHHYPSTTTPLFRFPYNTTPLQSRSYYRTSELRRLT